jgi:hypothetical protein
MASVHDLTHESGFVFEGQVEKLGASTASGYAVSAETAIVRVTRIVKTTPALSGYTDQEVTVHLRAPVSLEAGQTAVFFTHGVHYGDGMVVAEIGSVTGSAAIDAELASAIQASDDTDLTQRLAPAELVVTGVASAPKSHGAPRSEANSWRRPSEHDPDWWSATITVETVEKGAHAEKTVECFYANSTDIAWAHSHKVKEGDRGTWILHRRDRYGKAVPGLAATHPLDFQPPEHLNRVRGLLK